MSAKANWTPEQRDALVALLRRFSLTVENFDKLRSDSFEHALARHSLEHLELFYTECLKPGQSIEETQAHCPPWPPGTPRAGQLPSTGLIGEVGTKLRTEGTLNDMGRVSDFIGKFRERAKALPVGRQPEVLESLLTMVGDEMLRAKMEGTPIATMLDPLDRLMTAQMAKTKAEFEREKIELRKQAEARAQEKLQFERRKYRDQFCRQMLDEAARLKAQEIAENQSLTQAEKIETLGKQMFGELWD